MAVSQFLRPESLLEAIRNNLTSDVVHQASSAVGEPESATRQALFSSVPTILGGMTRMTSSSEGVTGLANMVREGGYEGAVSNPAALFGGGSTTSKMQGLGQQLLSRIFGNKSAAVSEVIATSSGVSTNSANRLMSLAAPMVMGVVSRNVASQGLNPLGLSNLLSEQKDEIAAASPAGLLRVLDSGPTVVPPAARSGFAADTERQEYSQSQREAYREARREDYSPSARYVSTETRRTGGAGRWLTLLLLALLGLVLFSLLRGRSARRAAEIATQQTTNVGHAIGNAAQGAEGALSSLALPGGAHVSVPLGSMNYNLATFLGSGEAAPKTFVFDHLNFQSSLTALTPESTPTLNSLASILKAYPNARVQLAGYTDNTGDPQANRRLSLGRANAVKGMLVAQGVSPDRIVAIGMGEDHPVAANDTEEGRAKNRRLELTVTSK